MLIARRTRPRGVDNFAGEAVLRAGLYYAYTLLLQ